MTAHDIRKVSSLDDVKSSHKEESNAAKAIALEHLGVIAARIRAGMLKWKASNAQGASLKSWDEVRLRNILDTRSPHIVADHSNS